MNVMISMSSGGARLHFLPNRILQVPIQEPAVPGLASSGLLDSHGFEENKPCPKIHWRPQGSRLPLQVSSGEQQRLLISYWCFIMLDDHAKLCNKSNQSATNLVPIHKATSSHSHLHV